MDWLWTTHIKIQMKEREIPEASVLSALENPDSIVKGKKSRRIYQKIIDKKLLRVVTEGNLLITVYLTDKISKYMEDL